MSAAKLTSDQARAILGLRSDAAPQALIGAFRIAAKQAHPDRPGGDAARFREILSAYRLLQSPPGLPASLPAETPAVTTPYVEIAPLVALAGRPGRGGAGWTAGAAASASRPAFATATG